MNTKKCPACGSEFGPEIGFCANDGTRLVDKTAAGEQHDHDPLVGRQIGGRYRLIKRIGEGGMGVVYLAEHEAIEKKLAIKILKEQYAQREDVVARFQQEAKSASRVKHQGVLEVFDFGRTEDHRFFLAMELLDGVDLAHTLEHETVIEPRRAVGIVLQVARALAAAHSKGVVHRDLKPENIFARLDELGREHVKIVDFGIAQLRAEGEDAIDPNAKLQGRKLTKTGMIFGTPEYMSPEQAAGKNVDQRVDVYALGIILFELLTGRTPFQGETFLAILNAHVMEPIPSLKSMAPPGFHCSTELENVVRSALAKDPEGRYRTMGDLADALLHTPEGDSEGSLLSRPLSYAPPPGGNTAAFDLRMPPAPKISIAPAAGRAYDASAATMVGEELVTQPPIQTTVPTAESNSTEATIAPAYSAPKKSGGGIAVAAIALLVLGGGGFFAYRSMNEPKAVPSAEPPKAAQSAPIVPVTTTAPSVAPSAEPASVSIHVETTPAGATVEREVGKDWVQVCSETPCDVKVTPGTTVHLRANKGAAVADKKLLADHDQKATLALVAPVLKPLASSKPGTDLCEVMIDEGIKVWRPCPKK